MDRARRESVGDAFSRNFTSTEREKFVSLRLPSLWCVSSLTRPNSPHFLCSLLTSLLLLYVLVSKNEVCVLCLTSHAVNFSIFYHVFLKPVNPVVLRRSVAKYKPLPVPKSVLMDALECAVMAPNHFMVRGRGSNVSYEVMYPVENLYQSNI